MDKKCAIPPVHIGEYHKIVDWVPYFSPVNIALSTDFLSEEFVRFQFLEYYYRN